MLPTSSKRLPTAHLEFARTWQQAAPGLGGWQLHVESADDGAQHIEISPPGVDTGAVFSVALGDCGKVAITQRSTFGLPAQEYLAADLPAALLLICPLSAGDLAGVETGLKAA